MSHSIPDIIAAPPRTREIEVEESARTLGVWPFAILITMTVVAVLIFHAHARIANYRLGYKLKELTEQHTVLVEENKQLLYEVSRLTGQERLEKIATEKLGLVEMEPQKLRKIEVWKGQKR